LNSFIFFALLLLVGVGGIISQNYERGFYWKSFFLFAVGCHGAASACLIAEDLDL
jgi:hypothetical protein